MQKTTRRSGRRVGKAQRALGRRTRVIQEGRSTDDERAMERERERRRERVEWRAKPECGSVALPRAVSFRDGVTRCTAAVVLQCRSDESRGEGKGRTRQRERKKTQSKSYTVHPLSHSQDTHAHTHTHRHTSQTHTLPPPPPFTPKRSYPRHPTATFPSLSPFLSLLISLPLHFLPEAS